MDMGGTRICIVSFVFFECVGIKKRYLCAPTDNLPKPRKVISPAPGEMLSTQRLSSKVKFLSQKTRHIKFAKSHKNMAFPIGAYYLLFINTKSLEGSRHMSLSWIVLSLININYLCAQGKHGLVMNVEKNRYMRPTLRDTHQSKFKVVEGNKQVNSSLKGTRER